MKLAMYKVDFNGYNSLSDEKWNAFISEVKGGVASSSRVTLIQNFSSGETNHLLIRLANSLGKPHTQPMLPDHPHEDEIIFRVEARSEEIRDARNLVVYSTTGLRFSCHTDGSGKRIPYDMVLLHCVRQDESGGDSILITLDKLLQHLEPETIRILQQTDYPFPFGRAPILSGQDADMWIRYNKDELDYYTKRQGTIFTENQNRALANLDDTIALLENRHTNFCLRPDDCLVFDNRRVLHGRSALCQNSKRLLKRIRLYQSQTL